MDGVMRRGETRTVGVEGVARAALEPKIPEWSLSASKLRVIQIWTSNPDIASSTEQQYGSQTASGIHVRGFSMNASRIAIAALLAFSAIAAQAGTVNVGGSAQLSTGTIVGTGGISGTTSSTAVSNLAGTGTSQFQSNASTGGNVQMTGNFNGGVNSGVTQSSFANVATSGSISGNAQPMQGDLTSNGAGSFANTATAGVETTGLQAVAIGGELNAFATGTHFSGF